MKSLLALLCLAVLVLKVSGNSWAQPSYDLNEAAQKKMVQSVNKIGGQTWPPILFNLRSPVRFLGT
jgi:hypothetical protein